MLYRFAGVCLDSASRLISGPDGPLAVPRRVFDCLAYLVEHRDRAVSRDELILHVWNRPNVSDTQLAQTVLRARRLLSDDGVEQRLIRTVPGFGYHWVGEVALVDTVTEAPADIVAPSQPFSLTATAASGVAAVHAEAPAAVAPSTDLPPRRRPARAFWSAAALVAAALLVLLPQFVVSDLPALGTAASPAKIVVLPVEIDSAGSDDIAWARLGLMDLIAARLRADGLVVPPSESVIAALSVVREKEGRLPLRPQALHAEMLVQPRLARTAEGWRLSLHGRRASGADFKLEQQHAQILEAAGAASDALLASLGRRGDGAPKVQDETALRLRAALLGNDLERIHAWLQGLPPEQRQHRDTRYLAAELDYRAGRLAESRRALDALLEDPNVAGDAAFRGRVLVARGSIAMRQRDYLSSENDFAAAIAVLDGSGAGRDLGRALMGRGGIALQQLRLDEADRDLRRAHELLGAAGDDLGVARAEVNLALVQRRRGHPQQALDQLQAAATRFGNYAAINELSATLASIIDLQCALLRWSDALASSNRAQSLLPRLPDRQLQTRLQQARADVLLGLGRLNEAQAVLDGLAAAEQGSRGETARNSLLAAEIALARGETPRAMQLALPLLAGATAAETRETALHAAALIQRADPRHSAEPLLPEPQTSGDPRDCVHAAIVQARRLQSQQRDGDAEALLRRGLAQTQQARDLREQRSVAEALAVLLLDQGRDSEAMESIAPLSAQVGRDFDTALLFARLHREVADVNAWQSDINRAMALAGERPLPAELTQPLVVAGTASVVPGSSGFARANPQ